MPSCSSSSNIQASLTALSTVQGGSRLTVSIPKTSGTGLTTGNVIRYDVVNSGYTWSKADDAASSEVFGVIEGLDSSANNFNVVIYGSINIDSSKLFDMGSGGGCGGNDIYFLSGTTAGALQNIAPTNLNHIVKPVYQVSPHGSYSGVVVNYLGYRIGGDVEAVSDDSKGIGEIRVYAGNAEFDPGFVDASVSAAWSITDYPDLYTQIGLSYGYVEQIALVENISGTPLETPVYQNGSLRGHLIEIVDIKTIKIRKSPDQARITTGSKNLSILSATYTPSTSSVHSVYNPKVSLGAVYSISGINSDGSVSTTVSQQTKIGIKIKPLGVNISIPTNITTPSLSANTILYGTSANDLEAKLTNLESRIVDLEPPT